MKSNFSQYGFDLVQGDHLQSQGIILSPNRQAFAVASKEGARLEGVHADLVLFIFDEAKEIPDEIWNSAIMGSLGNEFKALAVSTPGLPVGRFYETQVGKDPDWIPLRVTKEEAELEVPGFKAGALRLERAYGKESVPYRQHVLGEFAQDDEDSLIPLVLIEAAMKRWDKRRKEGARGRLLFRLGVDVGGSGSSNSVIASRYTDNWIDHLNIIRNPDTDRTVFGIQTTLKAHRGRIHGDLQVIVDAAGVGIGVADVSKNLGAPVIALYVSSATREMDVTGTFGFNNVRTELLWRLYERLNPDITPEHELMCLPPDDELMGELVAIKKIQQANGYKAESKEQVKRRIGRSPDRADAVMLAMAEPSGLAKVRAHEGNLFYT